MKRAVEKNINHIKIIIMGTLLFFRVVDICHRGSFRISVMGLFLAENLSAKISFV
jgi:hypothetical protein